MKIIKEEIKKVNVAIYYCDKCGSATEPKSEWNAFNCDISLRIGEHTMYDGNNTDEFRVDLCENCAVELFTKTLPELGIKINSDF